MLRVISSDGLQKRHCLKDRVTPIELMRQYTYAQARVRGAALHRAVARLDTRHSPHYILDLRLRTKWSLLNYCGQRDRACSVRWISRADRIRFVMS